MSKSAYLDRTCSAISAIVANVFLNKVIYCENHTIAGTLNEWSGRNDLTRKYYIWHGARGLLLDDHVIGIRASLFFA